MMKHKWYKEIQAWSEGAEIEAKFNKWDGWSDWELQKGGFVWFEKEAEYRIKPQPKQPKYLYAYIFNGTAMLTETKAGAANGGRYIGKIEVQDD
jgi:hypothetical protein